MTSHPLAMVWCPYDAQCRIGVKTRKYGQSRNCATPATLHFPIWVMGMAGVSELDSEVTAASVDIQ